MPALPPVPRRPPLVPTRPHDWRFSPERKRPWLCRGCGRRARKREAGECNGGVQARVALADCSFQIIGRSHSLWKADGVTFCGRCGAWSESRVVKLARECGPPTTAGRTALARAFAHGGGKHPGYPQNQGRWFSEQPVRPPYVAGLRVAAPADEPPPVRNAWRAPPTLDREQFRLCYGLLPVPVTDPSWWCQQMAGLHADASSDGEAPSDFTDALTADTHV